MGTHKGFLSGLHKYKRTVENYNKYQPTNEGNFITRKKKKRSAKLWE